MKRTADKMLKKLFCVMVMAVGFLVNMPGSSQAAPIYDVIYADVAAYHGANSETQWITDAICYASSTYGVDPILLTAVMETESHFNFSAYSGAGAVGLMQIMPSTGQSIGCDVYDPLSNIMGGAAHLRTLLDSFSGYGEMAVSDAVAAYNAGAQAVIDCGGCPPYSETINYVNKVYNAYMRLYSMCY